MVLNKQTWFSKPISEHVFIVSPARKKTMEEKLWFTNPKPKPSKRKTNKWKRKFVGLEKQQKQTVDRILRRQRTLSDIYVDVMAGDKLSNSIRKDITKQTSKLEKGKIQLKQIEKKMQFYIEQGRIKMEEQK